MKRLLTLIIAAIAFQSCSLTNLIPNHTYPSTDITINIDLQPAWGPIGYDYAAYYYMPEINVYYDVNHSRFYYSSGNRWLAVEYLPPSYRIYDLFKIYKVVLNYDNPWEYNRSHRSQYKHYRDDRTQIPIRLSNDHRYSKSWENLRPWVDPNRRSNRKNDYQLRTQNQQAGSNKYIEDKRNDGYRVNSGGTKQGATAGDAYRQSDRTPNNNTPSSSSSYREKSNTPTAPSTDGVSSRAKDRKHSSTDPKSKPQSDPTSTKSSDSTKTRSSKNSTDKSASSPTPSASYRTSGSTTTTTRGR